MPLRAHVKLRHAVRNRRTRGKSHALAACQFREGLSSVFVNFLAYYIHELITTITEWLKGDCTNPIKQIHICPSSRIF